MNDDSKFDEAYQIALQRKALFKDYLSRHKVMERLNLALEALYESTELPDDPGAFIAQQLTSQQELIEGKVFAMSGSIYYSFIHWSRDNGLLSEQEAAIRLEGNVDEPPVRSMSVSLSMRTKSIAIHKEWQSLIDITVGKAVSEQPGVDRATIEEQLLHSFGQSIMETVALENGYRGRYTLLARELKHVVSAGLSDARCSFELPEVLVSSPSPGSLQLKFISPTSAFSISSESMSQELIFKIGCMILEGAAMHLIQEYLGSDVPPTKITLSHTTSANSLTIMDSSDISGLVLEGHRSVHLKQETRSLLTFDAGDMLRDMASSRPPSSGPPSTSLSLPPFMLNDLFPFHIVIDQNCRIVQAGGTLRRLIPALNLSTSADRYFVLKHPCSDWSFKSLVQHSESDSAFVLEAPGAFPLDRNPSESYPMSFEIKGMFRPVPTTPSPSQFNRISDDGDSAGNLLLFAGTPRFASLDEMHALGLTFSDFPHHDASRDLHTSHHRTVQLAHALSEVRKSERDLRAARDKAKAREAKLFASSHEDSQSHSDLLNGTFHFHHRRDNRDSDSQALFVMSPVTRGDSMVYSGSHNQSMPVDVYAAANRLLTMRSGGLSESGRSSSRLNVDSRPNDPGFSGPLCPPSLSHMVSQAMSCSPHSVQLVQVDMDTPANKLLKMMDGIMSGQGVLLEDALAIQEAVAGGKAKWHEPINLKEQLKMSGLADDVNASLMQLLEGRPDENNEDPLDENLLEMDGLVRPRADCESVNYVVGGTSSYVREAGACSSDKSRNKEDSPSTSQPQTFELIAPPRSPNMSSIRAGGSIAGASVPPDLQGSQPVNPIPVRAPSEAMPSFSLIPSLISLQSWTKEQDSQSNNMRESPPIQEHLSVRFQVPASPSSSGASSPRRRPPPKKQGSWSEAAVLTARAASITSVQSRPSSKEVLNKALSVQRSATSSGADLTSISPSMSQQISLGLPNQGLVSAKARGSSSLRSAVAEPSPASLANQPSQRHSSVEVLEDGKLQVKGPGTRARRMSIPCAPYEMTTAEDIEPSELDTMVPMNGGGGGGRRSSLTSSDTPATGRANDPRRAGACGGTTADRSSPNAVLNSQSEVSLCNPHPALLMSHQNMSKRSSVTSGNSISILDAANLAKQARCKVLSVMVTVDETFGLIGTLVAGSSSGYGNPSEALSFHASTKGDRASGLSAALRKLQGLDAYTVADDSYMGSFDASPSHGPSDRLNLILAQVDAWQFDTFELDELTEGHALSALGFSLIKRTEAFKRFKMDESKLARFLIDIEAGYSDNFVGIRYHCATHAADVLRTLHAICTRGGLWVQAQVSDIGILCMYLSAVVHDYEHKGVNNDYLTRVSDPLALLYNDRSPMENHHCSASWMLLREHNFLGDKMPFKVLEKLRKTVIDMVLSTDMKQHFTMSSLWQSKMATLTRPVPVSPSMAGSDSKSSERRKGFDLDRPSNIILSTGGSGSSKPCSTDGRSGHNVLSEKELSVVMESDSSKQADGTSPPAVGLTDKEFQEALRNSNNTLHKTFEQAVSSTLSASPRPRPQSDVTSGALGSSPLHEKDSSSSVSSHAETSNNNAQQHSTRLQTSITPVIIHRSGKSFTHTLGVKGAGALSPGSPMFSTTLLHHPGQPWRQDRSGSGSLNPGSPQAAKGASRGGHLITNHSLHVPHSANSGTSTPRSTANNVAVHQAKGLHPASSSPHNISHNFTTAGNVTAWDEEGRLLAMQMALKWADVGHLASPLEVHQKWVKRLEEEMFMQGDQERLRGLPVSALMDRTKGQGITKSQTGFFNFVALPMYNAMVAAFPGCTPLLEAVKVNYAFWEKREAEAKAAAGASHANNTQQ